MGKKIKKHKKGMQRAKVTGGDVSMSLYDINKNIISQLPAYDDEKIKDLQARISAQEDFNHHYYMCLCNDIHYYTILVRTEHHNAEFDSLGEATTALLLERGWTIHADEQCDDHFEIWGKNGQETCVYLLFPYDQGVVTYG